MLVRIGCNSDRSGIMKDKFIIYNHTPNDINDSRLFSLIYLVISNGKLSNNNTEYCYVTTFKNNDSVWFRKTKSGYRIDVYNKDTLGKRID